MNIVLWMLLICGAAGVSQADTLDLSAIVVEASRSNDVYRDVTRPLSIVSAEQLERYPAKSLPELLGAQTGVYGIKYGNIKNASVDIRGNGEASPTNVLVLMDGRRTNQIDLSGQDWAQIDPDSIERVEIIRGAGTVLYGDNASGGVINIVTKRGGRNMPAKLTLSGEYGNYQSSRQGFDLKGGSRTLDYQLNFGHEQTTGFRAQSNYWANDWSSRFGFDPTEAFGIDVAQGYHLDRYELPGALFLSNIEQFGRRGVRPSLNHDHGWTSDLHFDVTPRLKFAVGPGEAEFSLLSTARRRSNKFWTGSTVFESLSNTDSYEFQPKLIVTAPLSGRLTHKATAGYDYFYAKTMRRSGFLGPSQDLLFVSKITHGLYALEELALDERWLLNLGARGTWADYVFDQKAVIPGKTRRHPKTQGYEGGLGFKYNPRSKIYVDYTRSYRLPATDEFFQNFFDFGFGLGGGLNADLTAQQGDHWEAGMKDQSWEALKWGMNFFAARYRREIYLDPATFVNTNYDGHTLRYGAEWEASLRCWDGKVEPFVNYTRQEAVFESGDLAHRKVPAVPRSLGHAGVTIRPLKHVSTTFAADYVGSAFAASDLNNTLPKLKPYTLMDWNARLEFDLAEVWLSIRNVWDTKYNSYGVASVFTNQVGYYPAPGRNVTAGIKLKF